MFYIFIKLKILIMKKFYLLLLYSSLTIAQTQIGLDIDGEFTNDQSGSSVSLSSDGSIVAIGAFGNDGNGTDSGHVRVYQNISGIWTQIGADINGESTNDYCGARVNLSSNGNVLAVSANRNNGNGTESGHVRIYQNASGVWTQIGSDIDGEAANDNSGLGLSLSSDGSIVAIGALLNDGNGAQSGHVRVYQNISGVWTQIGADIDGEAAVDYSGYSISLSSDGSIVAIGAAGNDENGTDSGHVRVYQNVSGIWTQIGADINGEAANDYNGYSVSLSSDGSFVAVGAHYSDGNGIDSGRVRIFQNISGNWIQIGESINGESADDRFGTFVSLSSDGNVVAIGANFNDGNGIDSGHVRVYKNISGAWTQLGIDIDGEATNDQSGTAICLSSDGNVVAVGANFNDGNGIDSGHVRVFDLSSVLSFNTFELDIFSIYPNPVKSTLNITTEKENYEIEIIDIQGKIVYSQKNMGLSKAINVSNFKKGVYFLNLIDGIQKTTKKFIVE
jgi:Flp pilus assembly pilin Flp